MNSIRTSPPPFHIPDSVNVLYPEIAEAANGVKLYAVDATDLDVVRVSLVFRAGIRFQDCPFAASATLNMLAEGTRNYTAAEISEKMDYYGAYYEVNIDRDYSIVSVCCLSKFLPEMLELLREIVVFPTFPESELEIYKTKRKQQLTIERKKISFRARELFAEALYGKKHPYGAYNQASDYDTLTAEDLKAFYEKHYTAGNCFAVASGNIGFDERASIMHFLENLAPGAEIVPADLPALQTAEKTFERKEGAVQSAIRVGKIMFNRNHPDYIGMQVLMTVLGGYFGSRLVSNLREDKGYTYGVFATMVNLEESGYMAIATEVGADVTQSAIREIKAEIARLRNELIGEEELSVVKNILTGEFMRILDGPFGIADVTIENIQCGTDNDYVNRFLSEVKGITSERLRNLAQTYLAPEGFAVIVVGES